MGITAHTMEYRGGKVVSGLSLRHYSDEDFEEYQRMYNACFREMRLSLGLSAECCASREELAARRDSIYILEEDGVITGSVAIYGNEIDDLVVGEAYRRGGRGRELLCFAVALLQSRGAEPIRLHVADVNRGALRLYLGFGFVVTATEVV